MDFEGLSVSELKVMNFIWNSGKKLSSKEITETFEEYDQTTKATTMTFLRRLEKKGYITSKKDGRVTYYKIKTSKEKHIRTSFEKFLNEIHNGSAKSFLKSLINSGILSQEIKLLIKKLKK